MCPKLWEKTHGPLGSQTVRLLSAMFHLAFVLLLSATPAVSEEIPHEGHGFQFRFACLKARQPETWTWVLAELFVGLIAIDSGLVLSCTSR